MENIESAGRARRGLAKGLACAALVHGVVAGVVGAAAFDAAASDHLDTPAVQQDGRLDMGDLYAWMSPDGVHLNLMMTVVGKRFAPDADYVFHIDHGGAFGRTTHQSEIRCRVDASYVADCRATTRDAAPGAAPDAGPAAALPAPWRVFAGLRLDPFFNNVRGARAAYNVGVAALQAGAARDDAGCPRFDRATSQQLLATWRQTEGGPPRDFLEGWETAVLALQIPVSSWVGEGGLIALWASTHLAGQQVDRAGRPLLAVSLLGTLGAAAEATAWRESFNRATPEQGDRFVAPLQKGLAEYDAFDGHCGNAWLAEAGAPPTERYRAAARLLADDRLWLDTRARQCRHFLAVERRHLGGERELAGDCGGRTPNQDANNVFRSLLVDGTARSISDGVAHKRLPASDDEFPFARPPAAPAAAASGPGHAR